MTRSIQKLDEALRLLDEIDTTPLSEINRKLDRIAGAVIAAKVALSERVVTVGDHAPEAGAHV